MAGVIEFGRHFLQEAYRMGFEVDEVQSKLETLFNLWRQEGEPPEDD